MKQAQVTPGQEVRVEPEVEEGSYLYLYLAPYQRRTNLEPVVATFWPSYPFPEVDGKVKHPASYDACRKAAEAQS